MTSDQLQRAQEIFAEAIELEPGEIPAFLQQAVGGDDADIRLEVESLLAAYHAGGRDFLKAGGNGDPHSSVSHPSGAAAAESDDDLLIGHDVGRYRVQSRIAHGGMGTVYEALQDNPRRKVALKVMSRWLGNPALLRRFRNEADILGRLRHPNIAQVFEAGVHELAPGMRVPFFALEFIPQAESITNYAAKHDLSTRQRLELFAKVCDAVHHGHQRGVIHRDLKPANILIDADGEPKVIDFGVARVTDSDVAATCEQSTVGQIVGTIQYMSPEQCDADPHELDTRSDVYSLGVVLFELLTGEPPYKLSSCAIHQATQIIRSQAPWRPSTRVRALRGDIETIVLKALEKQRERRYQSAQELGQEIRRYLNGEPVSARPTTAWTRCVRWAVRHPKIVTLVACLLFAAVFVQGTMLFTSQVLRGSPNELVVGASGSEVRLTSPAGNTLASWHVKSDGDQIESSKLLRIPGAFSGHPIGVLGFKGRPERDELDQKVCLFDFAVDLQKPAWSTRIEESDPVYDPHQRGYRGEDFRLHHMWLADVFREPAGPEIVAVWQSRAFTQSIVRIYDLTGRKRFEIWHDAQIYSCYFDRRSGQLMFTGANGIARWDERGVSGVKHVHPKVVFAIRPRLDQTAPGVLNCAPGAGPLDPVWYQCLLEPSVIDELAIGRFMIGPPDGNIGALNKYESPGRARLSLPIGRLDDAIFAWDIDDHGIEVDSTRQPGDMYKRNLAEHPKPNDPGLPDPIALKLGDLPPIVEMTDGARR